MPTGQYIRTKFGIHEPKQKICVDCGSKFLGGSSAKYCLDCKDKKYVERYTKQNRKGN